MTDANLVYLGDTIVNDFALSLFTNKWNDQWTISPGANGPAAQEQASNGQIFWNPADFSEPSFGHRLPNALTIVNPIDNPVALNSPFYFHPTHPLHSANVPEAAFAIELQENATQPSAQSHSQTSKLPRRLLV